MYQLDSDHNAMGRTFASQRYWKTNLRLKFNSTSIATRQSHTRIFPLRVLDPLLQPIFGRRLRLRTIALRAVAQTHQRRVKESGELRTKAVRRTGRVISSPDCSDLLPAQPGRGRQTVQHVAAEGKGGRVKLSQKRMLHSIGGLRVARFALLELRLTVCKVPAWGRCFPLPFPLLGSGCGRWLCSTGSMYCPIDVWFWEWRHPLGSV